MIVIFLFVFIFNKKQIDDSLVLQFNILWFYASRADSDISNHGVSIFIVRLFFPLLTQLSSTIAGNTFSEMK